MNTKKLPATLLLTLVTISLAFGYLSVLSNTDLVALARLRTTDSLFLWRSNNSPSLKHANKVVIVGVDEESFQILNRSWPWSRDIFARFVDQLTRYRPRVVGLDFSFVGRNPSETYDYWLSDVIGKSQNVVLASHFSRDRAYVRPLEILEKNAKACGFVDQKVDRDAVNRRGQILENITGDIANPGGGEKTVFSFATEIAYAYLGLIPLANIERNANEIIFTLPKAGRDARHLENIRVPADTHGNLWQSYRYNKNDLKYISFGNIIKGKVSRKDLEGKIVLVGAVSLEMQDYHPSPLGMMSGVLMNANEALMILDRDFIRPVPSKVEHLLLLLLVILFTRVFYKAKYIQSLALFLGTSVVIYGISLGLFTAFNILYEPFSPIFVLGLTYTAVAFFKGLNIYMEKTALQRMAITDSLTGLYGYRYLSLRLETEFNKSRRDNTFFFFTMIDIDLFKKVNDTYGHDMGNKVLAEVARVLKSGIRGYDVAARYGGEEFSLILFHHDEKGAVATLERVRQAVQNQVFHSEKGEFHVTVSMGMVSSLHPDIKNKDDLVRFADQALYRAKSEGRNKVCVYESKPAVKA